MKKKNKILKLWKVGMSKRAIGIKVGVQRSYVQKIIKQQEEDDELPYMAGVYDKGDY